MTKKVSTTDEDPVNAALTAFKGGFPVKSQTARMLAATMDNPGCNARRVLDAAGVDKSKVARVLGKPSPEGQSVFAIQRGNRFEKDVKANGYALLIELLRENGYPPEEVRVLPLRDMYPVNTRRPQIALGERARETRRAVAAMASGAKDAYNLIDGGALEWDLGGAIARLEADGIAWRLKGRIHIVEVKSFSIVDGQADADKVGAAVRQTAVYVAAMRDLLRNEGFDPGFVSGKVLLVGAKNASLTPTFSVIDVERRVRALARMLEGRASIPAILAQLDKGVTLDIDSMDEAAAHQHLASVLEGLGTNYLPACIASCSLARYCRDRARHESGPGLLGTDARASLGPVASLDRAIELAGGARPTELERDQAATLVRADRLARRAGVPSLEATARLSKKAG